MRPIERTEDPKINTLIELVERYRGRAVKDNPLNPLTTNPRMVFIGITDLAFPYTLVWTSTKDITDDTLVNPRIKDDFVFVEVRVGTSAGTGVGYHSDYAPINNGLRSLEPIVERCIRKARRESYGTYYDILKSSGLEEGAFYHKLKPMSAVREILPETEKKIPTRLIKQLARESAEILSQNGDDGRVRVAIHDETRRYVNSLGTVIRDNFFGYHFRFLVDTFDEEKRKMSFVQNLYFTKREEIRRNKILGFVKEMAREIEKRKSCKVVESKVYDLLLSPQAMSTQLHECFVHLLASDMILKERSTVWGWENFGKQVAHPRLSIYADPGMPERWGSMPFDYEGVPAERRVLIEKGFIRGYLADREGAYLLSEKTKGDILPGDARFQIGNDNTAFDPQPRISNLIVEWQGRRTSWNRLRQRFLCELARSGKSGIYLPDSSGAVSYMNSGEIEAYPNFPYLVTPQGEFTPVKFAKTEDHAARFVNSILAMDSQKEYCGHRCSGEDMADVRAGIVCGGGIVKGVQVNSINIEKERI